MVETAIELSDGAITADEIGELLALGKGMLAHPVDLLDGVAETIAELPPPATAWCWSPRAT